MEWKAFYSVTQFGQNREELRHGQLMHLLDRANFKRGTPLKVEDFMNFTRKQEEPELTPEQMAARIDREIFGL